MILNINEKLEENFSLHEFLYLPQWRIYAFPTKDQYENLKYLASKLQLIRNFLGEPMRITSGLRPDLYNKQIGGAPFSSHRLGRAADFMVKGYHSNEVRKKLIPKLSVIGLRMENLTTPHVHVDSSLPQDGGNYYFKP